MILRSLLGTIALLTLPVTALAGTAFEASTEKLGSTEIWVLFGAACAGLLAAVVVLLLVALKSGDNAGEMDAIEDSIKSAADGEAQR